MDSSTPKQSQSSLQLGTLSFGRGVEKSTSSRVFTMVFKCRKKGFDYLGQVRIEKDQPDLRVEIFNDNYFSHFEPGKNEVLSSLETFVLRRLAGQENLPSGYKTPILSYLEEKVRPSLPEPLVTGGGNNGSGIDLQEIFDRLNGEYFQGGNRSRGGVGSGF